MKKILLFVFALSPMILLGQLGEYYYSNGHPKAKGLNFQIKTPLGFEQSEADRPNIVQKWIKDGNNNDKLVLFMVLVKEDELINGFSKEERIQYLRNEGGVKDIASEIIPKASKFKYFVIDSYPGFIVDGTYKAERLDFKVKLYVTQIMVYIDSYMFSFTLTSPVKSIRDDNKRLLLQLANSIIFPDQYLYNYTPEHSPDRVLIDELTIKGTDDKPMIYFEGKAFTGVAFDVYENGQLAREINFKDGKQDGLAQEWHSNGQLYYAINFKDGKEDGLAQEWYDNGQLHREINLKDGKEDGLEQEWDENGQLLREETYKDGVRIK